MQDEGVGEEVIGCCFEDVGGGDRTGGYEADCFLAEAV